MNIPIRPPVRPKMLAEMAESHQRFLAREKRAPRADFSGMDLSGLDMTGLDFRGANFRHADLSGTILFDARLAGASFCGSDLTGADFTCADLTGADMRGCTLNGAKFIRAQCSNIDFRDFASLQPNEQGKVAAVLEKTSARAARFAGARLDHARFIGIHAVGTDFSDAGLAHARFNRAALTKTCFAGAQFHGTEFDGANLSNADMRGTIIADLAEHEGENSSGLERVSLIHARTDGVHIGPLAERPPPVIASADTNSRSIEDRLADHVRLAQGQAAKGDPPDFSGLDLRRAESLANQALIALPASGAILAGLDLSGSHLQGARLRGADLSGCNLRGADLRGADLTGAHLTGADLRDACLETLPLGTRSVPTRVSGANIRYADLRGSHLEGIEADEADCSWARMDEDIRAQLAEARMDDVILR